MSFADNAYYQQMGEAAREVCVKVGIIQQDQCALTVENLAEIVNYFHGELRKREEPCSEVGNGKSAETIVTKNYTGNSLLRKESANCQFKFTIEYTDFEVLDLLHELGHVFLELDKMLPGDVRGCDDISGGINELNASKFARAFIMPRALFEEVVLKHSNNGICKIQEVADEFKIDYWQVVSQGRQLQIW